MKNKPHITGILAVASPIPMLCFTVLWFWIWSFGIGMGLLHYNNIPFGMLVVSCLPLFISPAIGFLGILHGIIKHKAPRAWLGILLSCLGLAESFLLTFGIFYLGSIA